MSDIKLDIPDITVVVNTGDTYKVVVDTPATITTNTSEGYLTVADFASSASYALYAQTLIISGTLAYDTISASNAYFGNVQIPSASITGSFSGTLIGTSSWANNATTASYVLPSGLPIGTVSSSTQVSYTELQNIPTGIVSSSTQINTGSFSGSFTGTLIGTSSTATSASYVLPSGLPTGIVSSSTQINTGSFTGTLIGTASNATTASYILPSGLPTGTVSSSTQISYPLLQNIPSGIVSSSTQINTGSFSGSFTGTHIGSTFGTASNATTASYVLPSGLPTGTVSSSTQVSYPLLQNIPSGIVSSSTQISNYNVFATTGSNTFQNNQTISGSLTITQNLVVLGSSSINYVSQSTLDIGTNLITVNVQNPSVRFGGLAVIDSGSSPQRSGSLLFDSTNDQWIFVHQNVAGGTTSSIVVMGPPTFNNIGNETLLTQNRILKGGGLEHIVDSQITDDGTNVGIGITNPNAKLAVNGNANITGSLSVSAGVTASMFGTASWASNATSASYVLPSGLPTGLVSSSTQVSYTALQNIPSGIVSSSKQINTGSFTGSFTGAHTGSTFGTASNAVSASYTLSASFAPLLLPTGVVSSSAQINTGSFTGIFIGTASLALTSSNVLGGNDSYISLWKGNSALSSSLLFQTGSSILLGDTTHHTLEAPDRFGVYAGVTDSYNLLSAHGEINNYLQLNIKNFNSQAYASSDIVATADTGTELGGYINMGINSSNHNVPNSIGNPLDGYLFVTGSDLLIGNIATDKKIILFNGAGTALNNARVYIDSIGTVSINTGSSTPGNPEALLVKAIAYSYNMITAVADINNYSQVNINNKNGGNFASSDFVATANNGSESSYYVDMGINSDTYAGGIGGANDAYLYTTGSNLLIGNATSDKKLVLFAGSNNTVDSAKIIIDPFNQHQITGSLTISGSITITPNVVNQLTVSNAISASYAPGTPSISSSYALSASYAPGTPSISSSYALTASNALSASYAPGTPSISSSYALTASYALNGGGSNNWNDLNNIPSGLVSSSAQASTWTVASSSFATSASWAPSTPSTMVPIQDEGTQVVSTPVALNFIGSGVTVTNTSNTASITIPGGSGGDVSVKLISASYSFASSAEFIFTSGSFTVTLPSAIGIPGREYQIKNISTGQILITGSQTIDTYSDITITEKNTALGLISNGTNWSIF